MGNKSSNKVAKISTDAAPVDTAIDYGRPTSFVSPPVVPPVSHLAVDIENAYQTGNFALLKTLYTRAMNEGPEDAKALAKQRIQGVVTSPRVWILGIVALLIILIVSFSSLHFGQ